MREQIYTIPINEAFEKEDGCPLCRLHRDLEEKSLDYVMGAAMMEPDVRIATNQAGFCRAHLTRMEQMKNRLSLALMLQTRLPEVKKRLESATAGLAKRPEAIRETAESCYVCNRAADFMGKYLQNILYLYRTEPSFQELFARQPFFCVPHLADLLETGKKALRGREYNQFCQVLNQVESAYLAQLQQDVDTFCKSFDYRYSGTDLSTAKTSCERASDFLSGMEKR